MNIQKREIVQIALENLQKNTPVRALWKNKIIGDLDGILELRIGSQATKLNAEVKKQLRNHHIAQILRQASQYRPLVVISERIFPKLKEELRREKVAYLEGNGNIFLQTDDIFIQIDNNRPLDTGKRKPEQAFTKTGLKIIFHFLLENDLINQPYREIAVKTGAALGSIKNVMDGLKEAGFLLPIKKGENKLTSKKELLEKWMEAYEQRLKPALEIGRFRFLRNEDFLNWEHIRFSSTKTCWGGEPAGALLTGYLKPAVLTLYTTESRSDLIKNYRLMPDLEGNVQAYQKFWRYDAVSDMIAPPLLVYADLMDTGDRRCMETAQKIYHELLQDKL